MKLADFLWGNPYRYDTEDYKKYASLRSARNHMIFITWLNFGGCFRDYGVEPFEWMPVWSNYVFMAMTLGSFAMIFVFIYKMRKIGIDKKKLQFVEGVLEE